MKKKLLIAIISVVIAAGSVTGVVATKHKHDFKEVVTAPACTKQGFTTYTCECGETYVDNYVDALGHTSESGVCERCQQTIGCTHSYNDWVIDNEASCTTTGLKHHVCSKCNNVETEVIPALGHTGESGVCERCQQALECTHTYGNWIIDTEVSCTTTGLKHHVCSKCNNVETEVIPVLGHTTENGVCERCEQTIQCAHTYGDWIIDTEAGCVVLGSKHRVCSKCNDVETEVIPVLGHTTENGVCERCQQSIGNIGCEHDYGEWIIAEDAGCITTGSEYRVCSKCNSIEEGIIVIKGHTTQNGVCERCNKTIDTLRCSHDYGEWIIDIDAKCDERSVKHRVCSKCEQADIRGFCKGHRIQDGVCSICYKPFAWDQSSQATWIRWSNIYYSAYEDYYYFYISFWDKDDKPLKVGHCLSYEIINEFGEIVDYGTYNPVDVDDNSQYAIEGYTGYWQGYAITRDYMVPGFTSHGKLYFEAITSNGDRFSNTLSGGYVINDLPVEDGEYENNESWIVRKNWEFKVLDVVVDEECTSKLNNKTVVLITYWFKNLGFTYNSGNLCFDSSNISVYDQDGSILNSYYCTHQKEANSVKNGKNNTATIAVVVSSDIEYFEIVVQKQYDVGKTLTATIKHEITRCEHTFTIPTCSTARKCTVCDYSDGVKAEHAFTTPTCLTARKCTVCDYSDGVKGEHSYTNEICVYCNHKTPNYKYSINDAWTVDGQWEIILTASEEHYHCSSYLTDYEGFTNEQIVLLTFKYKNIGYGSSFAPKVSSVVVADEEGEMGSLYSTGKDYLNGCNHAIAPLECMNGFSSRMILPFALKNNSSTILVVVTLKDSNNVLQTASFSVDINPMENDPNLGGCTINIETSLPKTISYYAGSKLISACSITDISFEVSGDDLYIYFTGKKTYDSRGSSQSDACRIGWKLYDEDNNVIESGVLYTVALAQGEGFVNEKECIWDCMTAGKTYKLVLLNVN